MTLKTKVNSAVSHIEKGKHGEGEVLHFLESVFLLSRFLNDPTVGSLRDKKESCSTQKGLRVGTRFREFPQTPRGRGFSLLGFYYLFKYYVNVSVG